MKVAASLKKIPNPLFIILLTILVQIVVTLFYTNTKHFSIRALIRNLSIVLAVYYSIKSGNYLLLLIPIVLEVTLELLKYNGLHIEKYVATEYQYNDYWREIVKKNPILSNFSEANYGSILGLNTRDHTSENIKKIDDWSREIYTKSLINKDDKMNVVNIKKISDDAKFKLLLSKCTIKPNMRILEIGFGEGDFLNYIYENYGIRPIGVSISKEQVELVKSRGFEAYTLDAWKMTPELIGTYDLIIQCGNLEYIKCKGDDPDTTYTKYSSIINKLLRPDGEYVITCIHLNNENFGEYSLYDCIRAYFLWSGNDGYYPLNYDGFSKYANKSGLKTIHREERTNDYCITCALFFSAFQCSSGECVTSFSTPGFLDALVKTIAGPYYVHTYICYSPTSSYDWVPWMWEFIPQKKGDKWVTPATLEYIWFKKA